MHAPLGGLLCVARAPSGDRCALHALTAFTYVCSCMLLMFVGPQWRGWLSLSARWADSVLTAVVVTAILLGNRVAVSPSSGATRRVWRRGWAEKSQDSRPHIRRRRREMPLDKLARPSRTSRALAGKEHRTETGDIAAPTLLPLKPPVDHGAQEASHTAFAGLLSVASTLNVAKMNPVSA